MEYKTEFGTRFDKLQASSEMEIYRNLQALSASYGVFKGNYDELRRYLEHLNDPKKSLFMYSYEQRENLELLLEETSRLFHNFLASAKSLVDPTRVIVNKLYSNQEFIKKYQEKLERDIANNPIQKFVHKLRNYTQHYTLAWIFSLSAECGSDESNVNKFAQHFEDIELMLSNNRQCLCRTDTFQDMDRNWWCRVYPNNVSEVGIDSPESAYVMTELGILFYLTLRFAPWFRYALVGVEVDEFRTYSELIDDLSNLSCPGLVLAKELTQGLETLPVFRSFSSSYVWQPYEGEVYNPLMASPELKNKLNELLAAS